MVLSKKRVEIFLYRRFNLKVLLMKIYLFISGDGHPFLYVADLSSDDFSFVPDKCARDKSRA